MGQTEPALIVLNLFMPNKDGAEIPLYIQVRARPIKMLAISGQMVGGRDLTQTAMTLEAHDALAKLFDEETLVEHVETLLSLP